MSYKRKQQGDLRSFFFIKKSKQDGEIEQVPEDKSELSLSSKSLLEGKFGSCCFFNLCRYSKRKKE